jgi:cysteinyl-tRNA synthetase
VIHQAMQYTLLLLLTALSATAAPRSFAYLLQADAKYKTRQEAVAALRDSGRDWYVIDPVFGGDHGERWSAADLRTIRANRPERRVLAYLSIGEAEDYRPYWQKSWNQKPPAWLKQENPDWKGNFKVAYWHPEWQQHILAEIDRIVAAGFDGLYLDIVDGFEYFEQDGKKFIDHRKNPETGRTFRQDMIAWIDRIARHGRSRTPTFLIIPQNAAQLLESAPYREQISGIGVEDLFTNGKKPRPKKEAAYTLGFLKLLQPSGKTVLIIDYAKKTDLANQARAEAQQQGFVFLNTDRPLKTLGSP